MLQPQREHISLEAAQAEDPDSLLYGDLTNFTAEFKVYARLTYKTLAGDMNTGKCRLMSITYVAGTKGSPVNLGGFTPTNHAALSNLTWTASGHTGTANKIAGFGDSGEAVYLDQIVGEFGGIVTWLSGLSFAVSYGGRIFNRTQVLAESATITLDAADATFSRIDVIAMNIDGTYSKITGTPSATPQKPSIDPATQVELTYILLLANATSPAGITDELIYDENIEWTGSASGVTVDFNNATAPYSGAKCASVGAIGTNDYLLFTAGASKDRDDYESLSMFFKLKATTTTAHYLYVRFKLGANFVSNEIAIPWSRSNITTWQSIALQLTSFTFSNAQFDAVQLRWAKTGTQADHAGFYLDYIKLQTGMVAPVFSDTVQLIDDVIALGKTGSAISTALKVVNSNVGGYGTASKTVSVTVDAKGRVTAISENDISISQVDWQDWTFEDVVAGTAKEYVIDLKALVEYTINSIVLVTDNGTLTGVALKINGSTVTGISSVTVDTNITETAATAANVVAIGDKITFHTSTGYTGTPTKVSGKINFTRS